MFARRIKSITNYNAERKTIVKQKAFKSQDELPMYLSVMDLANLLGISRASAYELAAKDGFPKLKAVPGRIIIPREQLLSWLKTQTTQEKKGWGNT